MTASPKVKSPVRFENIAYRGASGLAPENTLRACDIALRKGATMVDLNVRLSSDGIPVLFHDEEVGRKTNGRGPVSSLSLKELRKLRITGGRGKRVYEEPISTLEEAILLLRERAELALELMGEDEVIVQKVVELVNKYELPRTTTLLAHHSRIFRALRAARTNYRIGRVLSPRAPWQRVVEAIRERPAVLVLHRGASFFWLSLAVTFSF